MKVVAAVRLLCLFMACALVIFAFWATWVFDPNVLACGKIGFLLYIWIYPALAFAAGLFVSAKKMLKSSLYIRGFWIVMCVAAATPLLLQPYGYEGANCSLEAEG